MQEQGVEVSFLPANAQGIIDYEKLPSLIKENTRAIIVTHASNLTGNITDLERIKKEILQAKAFRKETNKNVNMDETKGGNKEILFLVDGSQTAGILPVDVQKMGIDVFCFTGHKGLMGPQGTGGLYVRPTVKINPLKVGGSGIHSFDHEHPAAMPEHLEAGTLNVHGIAGLGGALHYLNEIGTESILQREQALIKRLEDQIRDLSGIHLYGNPDTSKRVGILSFNMGDEDSAYVADWLFEEHGIAVRAGAHCAPLMHETLGTAKQGAVRISVSHKNTEEEIDATAKALTELSKLLE